MLLRLANDGSAPADGEPDHGTPMVRDPVLRDQAAGTNQTNLFYCRHRGGLPSACKFRLPLLRPTSFIYTTCSTPV
jgi:hypothetical protein